MKLKKLKKLIVKLHKERGNVDVKFIEQNGNGSVLELEYIDHFNFAKDVTITFKRKGWV